MMATSFSERVDNDHMLQRRDVADMESGLDQIPFVDCQAQKGKGRSHSRLANT